MNKKKQSPKKEPPPTDLTVQARKAQTDRLLTRQAVELKRQGYVNLNGIRDTAGGGNFPYIP